MDNVEDMDGFEIDIGKYIYMFILFVVYINCLFICSMLTNHFILNGIVEIASIWPMPMDEDLSTIVLVDNERCATLCLELVSSAYYISILAIIIRLC